MTWTWGVSSRLLQHCQAETSQEQLRGATHARGRGGGWEGLPTPEVRGGGQEEQLHLRRAVAAWAQEGLEELLRIQGQEGRG